MKSINEKIEGFFEREVKFLRPIGPMAFLISMAGSSPPTDQQTPYRRFASVESRMFYAKSTITVALNQMGTEESRPLRDRLIPASDSTGTRFRNAPPMAMKSISEDIRRTINREIDIGTKSVTKSFHSQPVMAATEGMTPEEQESLIDPFLSVEFRLLSIKVLSLLKLP